MFATAALAVAVAGALVAAVLDATLPLPVGAVETKTRVEFPVGFALVAVVKVVAFAVDGALTAREVVLVVVTDVVVATYAVPVLSVIVFVEAALEGVVAE